MVRLTIEFYNDVTDDKDICEMIFLSFHERNTPWTLSNDNEEEEEEEMEEEKEEDRNKRTFEHYDFTFSNSHYY